MSLSKSFPLLGEDDIVSQLIAVWTVKKHLEPFIIIFITAEIPLVLYVTEHRALCYAELLLSAFYSCRDQDVQTPCPRSRPEVVELELKPMFYF